ncbi:hypothetical protein OKJ48_20560 [Streptomyces kunmingensis]|uniref:Uncharacterized protein n=1 Tax=Streptomyces kunmingensis TaxID=68225 RepID=A0ABU6CE22_9ACTN|nr:hypothetical protein [Streptomyces kunmingensis]MEB3962625.1 hypothetical protein [Streptomyces kunmingensis]
MSASERVVRRAEPSSGQDVAHGVSMGDLLASCAAARAVSTPPRQGGAEREHPRTTVHGYEEEAGPRCA